MSSYAEFNNELKIIGDIYLEITNVYHTVFRYLRLDKNLSEEECEKRAVEVAEKKRDEMLIQFSNGRLKKAFNL